MTAPAKKPKNAERIREVGQREETLRRQLSADEIATLRDQLEVFLDEADKIKARAKEAAKNFASQLETNTLQLNDARQRIKEKHIDEKVLVKEYLTKGNEIVRIRADTDEPIGVRTATKAELQEEMFQEKKPAEGSPETGEPQKDAQPAGLDFGGDVH